MILQFSLNTEVIHNLRAAINDNIHIIMMKHVRIDACHRDVPAWDLICSIMDRIEDTAAYLNSFEIEPDDSNRSAFSFYNLMNNSAVMLDCINKISSIFMSDYDQRRNLRSFFFKDDDYNIGSDEEYFRYLRALCAVHPIETTRHTNYQNSDIECCPFVLWNNPRFGVDGDLCAIVYSTRIGDAPRKIGIKLHEIIEYVTYKYESLNEVTEAVKAYQDQEIKKFQETPLRQKDNFCSLNEYAEYLRNEEEKRRGSGNIYVIDYFIKVLNMKLSNKSNQAAFERYTKAIEYAISFYAKQLQEMDSLSFQTNGIKYTYSCFPSTLLDELYDLTYYSEERGRHHNALEKISQLNYDSNDKELAYNKLNSIRPFLEQYISFEDANDDFEYYVLVQIALYHDCLKYPCVVNRNIPNTLDYRERVIPEEEWSDLVNVHPPAEPTGLFEDLLGLINNN